MYLKLLKLKRKREEGREKENNLQGVLLLVFPFPCSPLLLSIAMFPKRVLCSGSLHICTTYLHWNLSSMLTTSPKIFSPNHPMTLSFNVMASFNLIVLILRSIHDCQPPLLNLLGSHDASLFQLASFATIGLLLSLPCRLHLGSASNCQH